jgi:hypothetical protein
MNFMENNANGYIAWVWDGGASCPGEPALISSWSGAATGYGQTYKSHILTLP